MGRRRGTRSAGCALAITVAAFLSIALSYRLPDYASMGYLAIGPLSALFRRLRGSRPAAG